MGRAASIARMARSVSASPGSPGGRIAGGIAVSCGLQHVHRASFEFTSPHRLKDEEMTAIAQEPSAFATQSRVTRDLPKYFYTWMAGLCMIVAFAGFTPSYWARVATGTFTGAPIFHIHGLLFSFWTVFFVAQAALASSGRIARHRAVGLVGISLATSMVIVGILVSLASLQQGVALGFGEQATAFSIVSLTGIVVFAGLFIAAVANVRRPEVHKRLMLVSTVSLLQAAIGRVFRLFLLPPEMLALPVGDMPPPPVLFTVGAGLAVDLIIVVAMVFDWRTRGRPHPAYLIGGGLVLATQLLRVPMSETAAWRAIANGMLALAG